MAHPLSEHLITHTSFTEISKVSALDKDEVRVPLEVVLDI